jgi:hypothetical protein
LRRLPCPPVVGIALLQVAKLRGGKLLERQLGLVAEFQLFLQ